MKILFPDGDFVSSAPELLCTLVEQWFDIEYFLSTQASRLSSEGYNYIYRSQTKIQKTVEKATGKQWTEVEKLWEESFEEAPNAKD